MFVIEKIKNYFSNSKNQDSFPSAPQQMFSQIMSAANDPSQDRISYGHISQMDIYYLAVFDGHGGSKVSSYLQQNIKPVITQVISHFKRKFQDIDEVVQSSFKLIFKRLEEDVLQIMNNDAIKGSKKFQNCGSCALLAIVTKTNIHIANVGDSQGLIINSNPQNSSFTNSCSNTKSPSELQKLKNKFPLDQQLFVNYNNTLYIKGKINVTSSIGDFSMKYKKPDSEVIQPLRTPYVSNEPQIKRFQMLPDDKYLLLASDGLWDLLTPSCVSQIINNNPFSDCLEVIIQQCYQKCAQKNNMRVSQIRNHKNKRKFMDDISIVLLDLSKEF